MRRRLDQYFTPASATRELLEQMSIRGTVLECCSGDDAITAPLRSAGLMVCTNDIDPAMPSDFHRDMAAPESWVTTSFEWVISNPPFSLAPQIVPLAFASASVGIAMLLRLSFLEPVENRGAWLNANPPTHLIVLPRISFTGDGKTDNVTCAWMVWRKHDQGTITIAKNPKFAEVEP